MLEVTHNNLPAAVSELLIIVKDLKLEIQTLQMRQHVEPEKLMNINEAAEYLGTTKAAMKQNDAPRHLRLGKLYFFKNEIDAWIKSGRGKVIKRTPFIG